MCQVISSIAVVLLVITVNYATGLKWIPLTSGDVIPTNAVIIINGGNKYVGRARHYDEVLPAEINTTFSIIESCGQNIIKKQYEILLSQENCQWKPFSGFENIPENIVRGGTAPNGEPIYIGKGSRSGYNSPNNMRIESVYLTSKTKNTWSTTSNAFVLVCEDNNKWIDTSSVNIPNNTIYGGLSIDKNHIYVGRLKSGCSIIPGQVTPELGIATATYKHEKLQSAYSQVLVGDPNEYKWVTAYDGDIPDYAVVGSKDKTGELMYVALINKTLRYVMPSTALKLNTSYELLVKNVESSAK